MPREPTSHPAAERAPQTNATPPGAATKADDVNAWLRDFVAGIAGRAARLLQRGAISRADPSKLMKLKRSLDKQLLLTATEEGERS